MDINLIKNICLTALLVAAVSMTIINTTKAESYNVLTALLILIGFFGGAIVSIITLLMIIWAN